ncbi:MAG: carboxylate-amine ligase [Anaerolineae bacterium]|nr:carboxylate-amine ligase [Anaerolineae bacterium]
MKQPASDAGPFDLGVEEEYHVVDPHTWELRSKIHPILELDMENGVEDVRAEFLQSQVEAVTRICANVQEVRAEVERMRQDAHHLARDLGMAIMAAGTHPFSPWPEQEVTQGERYAILAHELQDVGRRLIACGLHIHVGIRDPDLRILVMNQMRPFLPFLLALSTSSPFLEGRFTGLHSYRSILLAALPRSGTPPRFDSWDDYQRTMERLLRERILDGPSFVWWDARPSSRYPTLEIRSPDMPTRIEETVCIVAWIQALAVKLTRDPFPYHLHRFVIEASKWQAVRYGLDARIVLPTDESARGVREWVGILLDWLADVAEELDSRQEMAYAHTIASGGTSADRQIQVWHETRDVRAVAAHLVQETEQGL